MASVFKRREQQAIPDGAEIIERRRKATAKELRKNPERTTIVERWAKWTDSAGRTDKALLNAAGDKIIVERAGYTIVYTDHRGKRKKVGTKYPDRDSALRYAQELETAAENRRRGRIDPKAERYASEARRPLSEHLADFRQYLTDKQNTDKHVDLVCSRVGKLIDDCKAQHIADLTDAAVMGAIGAMKAGGAGLQTLTW